MTTALQESTKTSQKETFDRKTWTGKFSLISPWFSDIVTQIKQQLKSEHLSLDPTFVRKNFNGMPLHRISLEEMKAVYLREILSGQNQLAEFISNRWLFRNLPLYKFFETKLEQIGPSIETIQMLEDDTAKAILDEARAQFSIEDIFCFVTLNEVQLSQKTYDALHKEALDALSKRSEKANRENPNAEKEKFAAELKKNKEKYEQKVEELQRKHELELTKLHQEIQSLKKQLKERQ